MSMLNNRMIQQQFNRQPPISKANTTMNEKSLLLFGIVERVDKIQVASVFLQNKCQAIATKANILDEISDLINMMQNWRAEIKLLKTELASIDTQQGC